jgi:hypothetical protein
MEESSQPRFTLTDVSVLVDDPNNARVHNERNIEMIAAGMDEFGAARSIVVNEDNQLLAGTGAKTAFIRTGRTKLLIVDLDGDTLLAARRSGLSEREQLRLALLDNRANETSDFDPSILLAIADREDVPLLGMWTSEEIAAIEASMMTGDEEPKKRSGARRMAFRLDFDDSRQKARFERFRNYLKEKYGEELTEAERFDAYIEENCDEAA